MRESDKMTLREMTERLARWFPKEEAVVDETTRLTFKELKDQAQQCAALYHKLGVRKGDRIALMLFPSTIHTVALFGAIELGALPVALHIRETPKGLSQVIERMSPRILVYDAGMEKLAKEVLELSPLVTYSVRATSSVPGDTDVDANPSAVIPADLKDYKMDFDPMPVYAHDPAVIVLSSGTTGVPKGVVHTNYTLVESARGGVFMFNGIKPGDAIVNVITTSFVGWYNLCIPFLNAGAKVVFRSKWDPVELIETIPEEKVTHTLLIPTMWRMLFAQDIDFSKYDLSCFKIAGFAGEVMDPVTLEKIKENISNRIVNLYGTTETGSCSAGTVMFDDNMVGERLESVGKPMLNSEIRIVKQGGTRDEELPQGESGEVIICGPSIANMIWDNPKKAREIFKSDGTNTWWHSGDLGHVDEDGFLYLEGRTDDMIISGGINIMPARVEDELRSHPDVVEVAVVGTPDEEWGQKVKAVVVSKNPDLKAEDLEAFMKKSELAGYQRPRIYEFVEELPKTATGKLNRKAMRGEA